MDPQTISAIVDRAAPRNSSDVQCFLQFTNFYRWVIKSFSKVVNPVIQMLCKDTAVVWMQEAKPASDKLKEAFTSASVRVHPDQTKPFVVKADTSNCATGALLSQQHGSPSVLDP